MEQCTGLFVSVVLVHLALGTYMVVLILKYMDVFIADIPNDIVPSRHLDLPT